jgi:hypothetical protein
MPIEVRQLAIRMSVGDEKAPAADPGDSGQEACGAKLSPEEREAIVQQCVRQVLGELRLRRER